MDLLSKNVTLFVLCVLFSVAGHSSPSRVILIRHGEKISDSFNDLSSKGCQRAYLLPLFFKTLSNSFGGIYGAQAGSQHKSIRSLETIAPTARWLQLKINNRYLPSQYSQAAKEILSSQDYNNKTVIVAWAHDNIPDFAKALGLKMSAQFENWPKSVFDQAWVLSYNPMTSQLNHFDIIAEHVLPTDISNNQSGISNWGRHYPPQHNGIVVPPEISKECDAGNFKLNLLMESMLLVPFK